MKVLKIAAVICALAVAASLCGCDIMDGDSSLSSRVDSSLQSSDGALESIFDLSEPMDDILSEESSEMSEVEEDLSSHSELSLPSEPEEEFSSEASAAMSTDFNFLVIDANEKVEVQQQTVRQLLQSKIDLSQYMK